MAQISSAFRTHSLAPPPKTTMSGPSRRRGRNRQTGLYFPRVTDIESATTRENTPPSKRVRANTAGTTLPILPPDPVPFTPPLKPSSSFFFRAKDPLYTRHVIKGNAYIMEIRYTQPSCESLGYRQIPRLLTGTTNLKTHYRNHYPGIPTSEVE